MDLWPAYATERSNNERFGEQAETLVAQTQAAHQVNTESAAHTFNYHYVVTLNVDLITFRQNILNLYP